MSRSPAFRLVNPFKNFSLLTPLTFLGLFVALVANTLWRAWIFMLLIGIAHLHLVRQFPAVGYATSFWLSLIFALFVGMSLPVAKTR